MRFFSYVLLLVLMLIGLTFASLNSNVVVFNYYLGTKEVALSLLLVGTFGVGIFFGLMTAILMLMKLKKDNILLKSRMKNIEKELENLRSIPIKGE